MEKVAIASPAKPKSQQVTNENLQRGEEQAQDADVELIFNTGHDWFHAGGREIDLSGIPAYAGLPADDDKIPVEDKSKGIDGDVRSDESSPGNETDFSNQTIEAGAQADNTRSQQTPDLIADDSVPGLSPGQMRKAEFLQRLRAAVTTTIEPVLATAGQTTDECPYLNYWFDLYQYKEAAHVEQAVKKYAPSLSQVATAAEYISIIAQRTLKAAQVWVKTGRITGVPDGIPNTLPGMLDTRSKYNRESPGKLVQFKTRNGGVRHADDAVALQSELGPGQPLNSEVRSRMEAAFGMDFSRVRAHTDSRAATISNRVNARAFTIGNHIAFGNGEYQPGTLTGDALLAHELAHTVQQREAKNNIHKIETGDSGYSALEADADHTAAGVLSQLWGKGNGIAGGSFPKRFASLRSGLRLQRCSSSKTPTYIRAVPQNPTRELLSNLGMTSTVPLLPGPTPFPNGGYLEFIGWETDGRNGNIVQEIKTNAAIQACAGNKIDKGNQLPPRYWEAWHVDGDGKVKPIQGLVNDVWKRNTMPGSSGSWTIEGTVYWADSIDISKFSKNNRDVPGVEGLLTTTTEPLGLSKPVPPVRRAAGSWNC